MSVMVLTNKEYINITNGLAMVAKSNMGNAKEGLEYIFDYKGRTDNDNYIKCIKQFILDIRKSNLISYHVRYNDPLISLNDDIFKNVTINPFSYKGNICSLVKSLRCVRYQLEEELPINKTLKNLINRFQQSIVMSLPEYEKAEWGA